MGIDVISALVATNLDLHRNLTLAWQTLAEFGVLPPRSTDLFAYFRSLDSVLIALNESGATEVVEAAITHVDCLADKAGCSPAVILGGGHFAAESQVILDALANISDVLQAALRNRPAEEITQTAAEILAASAEASSALRSALVLAWGTLAEFRISLPRSIDLFAYFISLHEVLTTLDKTGMREQVKAVMAHIDYLANKAGSDSAIILGGGDFTAAPTVILDCLANIGNVLQATLQGKKSKHLEDRWENAADADSASVDASPALQDVLATAWQTLSGFRIPITQSAGLSDYFTSLNDVLMTLTVSGATGSVESVMSHVDYLAEKAGRDAAVIVKGGQWSANEQVILEAVINIDAVLRTVLPKPPEPTPEGIPEGVFALILEAESKLAGWCSREKALVLARTVLQERPRTCVEIGIFGGRSLVPCAAALQHIGSGAIYGIEAWNPNIAIENATNEVNDDWWLKVDFASIKQEFYRFVAATDLTQHVRVIEAPSGRAAALFDQIDFLHIDGSHSMVNAAEDVILYARKVRSGGIVVFDDVNWQSTAPARELLAALCDTVTVLKDPESGQDICAVLRRR
jgi:glutathione S-transferase